MVKLPEIGKITAEVFDELIFPRLGAKRKEVLVGPEHGVDVGIVMIGDQAVAMTADPVFIVPEYGFERAAWFAIHILASDVVTSGLPPSYLSIDLNLPLRMTEEELTVVWETIHRECQQMGTAIICGHTARYDNCEYPMVGGATFLAVGAKDKYVSPRFIKCGDALIITKGPAIEAAGIFATMFPRLLAKEFGNEFSRQAQSIFYKMSVVKEAMAAVTVGVRDNGVSAMHDATECGIWGGVYELAKAAGLGVRIEKEKIVQAKCVSEICDYFKIDPYKSISEGTLLLSVRHGKAAAVVETLQRSGIDCSIVGEFTDPKDGMVVIENGTEKTLEHPRVDPFWKAFYDALKQYGKLEQPST
jgi:hydrogenase maturation factor